VTGAALTTVPTTVDVAARSFVVRVPRAVLPAAGAWRVRLGSGLASADGTGLAPATGAPPGAAALYNLGIRDRGGGRADVYDARGEHRWSGSLTLSAPGGSTPVVVPAGARELLVLTPRAVAPRVVASCAAVTASIGSGSASADRAWPGLRPAGGGTAGAADPHVRVHGRGAGVAAAALALLAAGAAPGVVRRRRVARAR